MVTKTFLYQVSNAGANAEVFDDVFWQGDKYWFQEGRNQEITSWTITVGDDAFGRLAYLEGKEARECWTHELSDGKVQLDLNKVMKKIYGVDGLPRALALVEELEGSYINLLVHISYTVNDTAPAGGESAGVGEGQPSAAAAPVAPPETMVEIENVGAIDLNWGRLKIPARQTVTVPKKEMAALSNAALVVANPSGNRPPDAYRYTKKSTVPSPLEPGKKERHEISAKELDAPMVVVSNTGEVPIDIVGMTIPPGGTASIRKTSDSPSWWFQFAANPGDEERKFFDWTGGEISGKWPGWGGVTNVSVRVKKTERRGGPPPKLVPETDKGTESNPARAEPGPRPKPKPESRPPLPPKASPEPSAIVEEKPEPLPDVAPPVPEPEIPAPVVVEKPKKEPKEEVVPKPVNPEEAKGKINGDWHGLEEWEEGEDLPRLRRMSEGMAGLKGSGVPGGGLPDWNTMQRFLHACDDYAKKNGMASNTAREILDVMGHCQGWDEFLERGR